MTALVAPARMLSTLAEENGVVRVRIPARRSWLVAVFLAAWLFGLPLRKEYDLQHVRNLRVVPFDASIWSGRDSFGGMRGGPLAFDYGAKTVRFGTGIDEAEARMILDSIRTRFPELGS